MEHTRLGDTGLRISRLALGCMSYGDPTTSNAHQWSLDDDDAQPFFRQAVEMGVTFWDTANVYQAGTSEEVVGRAIKRSGVRLGGRLIVGALVDEEGDMLGAKHLCTTPLGRELSAAIVCEPEQNELCLEQRGVVWARVTARGRMAHGAMPEAGANPITALAALVADAPRLERRLRALCTRSRYLRPPTVTPTVIAAPVAGVPQSNVIPAAAHATLDVRLTPGPDAAAVAKEIGEACRRAADRAAGVTIDWAPINGFRLATRVERTEPLVRAMVGAVRRATGRPARWGGVPGSTDGTILRMELGIPIVTCGPGGRLIPHQVDEHVDVAELVDAARIYVAAALAYLKP